MSHAVTLEQLTTRLGRLEGEITAIRQTLEMLQQNADTPTTPSGPVSTDKINLSEQMRILLQRFSIAGGPVGPETLQKQMVQADLSRNELSQSLIEARGQ